MGLTLVLSDGHLGKVSDTPQAREAKSQSYENIAEYTRQVRPTIVIALGDLWHHMSGNLRDFDDDLAIDQLGSFSEEWRQQGFTLVGIAGNTDKQWLQYNKQPFHRSLIRDLLSDPHGRGNLNVPRNPLWYIAAEEQDPNNTHLLLHGHEFVINSMVRKLYAVLTGDCSFGAEYGQRIFDTIQPNEEFHRLIVAEKGSHRMDYLLSVALRKMLSMSPTVEHAVWQRLQSVYGGLHTAALGQAAKIIETITEKKVKTAWMGHTHLPSNDGSLINTGTSGAENSLIATFGQLHDNGHPELLQSWHPDLPKQVIPWQQRSF